MRIKLSVNGTAVKKAQFLVNCQKSIHVNSDAIKNNISDIIHRGVRSDVESLLLFLMIKKNSKFKNGCGKLLSVAWLIVD